MPLYVVSCAEHGGSRCQCRIRAAAVADHSDLAVKKMWGAACGFDHGAGHSLLLLYDAKTSHGENINDFNSLGYDSSIASKSLF